MLEKKVGANGGRGLEWNGREDEVSGWMIFWCHEMLVLPGIVEFLLEIVLAILARR
jgi:hypothetical protein